MEEKEITYIENITGTKSSLEVINKVYVEKMEDSNIHIVFPDDNSIIINYLYTLEKHVYCTCNFITTYMGLHVFNDGRYEYNYEYVINENEINKEMMKHIRREKINLHGYNIIKEYNPKNLVINKLILIRKTKKVREIMYLMYYLMGKYSML